MRRQAQTVPLISEVSFLSGGTPRMSESRFWGGDIPWVSSGEMTESRISYTERRVTEDGARNGTRMVPANTVLVVVRGMSLAKEFRISISERELTFNQDIKALQPSEKIDPWFLFYYLKSQRHAIRDSATDASHGTKKLETRVLEQWPFPLLDIPTQRSIASILSAYDDLIENNRRRIQLLEQAARLLYKEWFVHLRFPGHEHTQMIDGVPEGWEKKPLGELLTLQRGFDLPVSKRKDGRFPIYASTGINGYHAEAKVKGPGVVTGRSGTLGTVMYVSGDFWPLNTTLWVKEFKLVGPHYANHLLTSMQLEQYNGGAAVPTLNRNDVHRVEVLSPPAMLLRMFEDQSHDIVKQIDALTSMNIKLAEARDLLLPKLMNGEVAV